MSGTLTDDWSARQRDTSESCELAGVVGHCISSLGPCCKRKHKTCSNPCAVSLAGPSVQSQQVRYLESRLTRRRHVTVRLRGDQFVLICPCGYTLRRFTTVSPPPLRPSLASIRLSALSPTMLKSEGNPYSVTRHGLVDATQALGNTVGLGHVYEADEMNMQSSS